MPTVYRGKGFQIRVLLPPREHEPAHVHVHKAGALVVMDLPHGNRPLRIRKVSRMRDPDVVAAVRLVESMVEELLQHWKAYHGPSSDE
jgi:hypothetical protein